MLKRDQTDALIQVTRPSRYLGGELGSLCKPLEGIDLRMALAFPDVYEVGMSHIGFPILYNIINSLEWAAAERVYMPWADMEQWLRDHDQPLCSLESSLSLAEFDVLGFTLQYELSYTNLLAMLDLGGVPLRRENRSDAMPLVVVGGPCAYNPEPLADFFDVALIGDGEEAIVDLLLLVRQAKAEGWPRQTLLHELAACGGFYIPELFDVRYHDDGCVAAICPLKSDYPKVERRFLSDLETAPFPTQPIVPFMETVHNRVALEIARGCTRGCRFCQAGYIYRPVRERSPEKISELISESLENSGYEDISLLSLSSGDYTCIEPLLQHLMARYADDRVSVSLPSLRVGSLTPELMEEVKKVRKSGFTLAPEAGSERLRKLINKGISADDLLETTRTAYRYGWRLIKLYFMMGLPTETDEDLEALIDLAAQVKKSGKGTGGNDVNVAVSTFVPKPHTPFQWEAQIGIDETLRKQRLLREGLRQKKLRFKYHGAESSFLEGVFARGDRRLAAVLEKAFESGCRFDGWRECFDSSKWLRAFAACHVDPEWYLRQRNEAEILPWDHIDCGIPKKFFLAECNKAFSEQATLDCRDGNCHGCDICDFKELKMRILDPSEKSVSVAGSVVETTSQVDDPEKFIRMRLKLRKTGRARMVGHLEYLKMFQRAVRRAHVPIRFSQGFHPTPKISYLEALPMGVSSEAELIDLELRYPVPVDQIVKDINVQLPEGFKIIEGNIIAWKADSPSATVASTCYRVPLPEREIEELDQQLSDFLAAEEIVVTRGKKGKEKKIDIRPDILNVMRIEDELQIELVKGSPLQVAALLLNMDVEDIRRLGVRKTGITLKS